MKVLAHVAALPVFWVLASLCGCTRDEQIKLISDERWPIGEAKDCTVDRKWSEAHCFPPMREALSAKKHEYLVKVVFGKPLLFDQEGWAYNVTCRLDSSDHATCIQQSAK